MIELALAFQDKDGLYAEHAGVVLASVFRNTSSPVHVHILHDESLSADNQQRLTQLAASFNQTLNFYPIAIPEDMLAVMANINSVNVWTQACMYRLLLPILPVDKVIYLDCDVLVNMDINELWQIELNDCYLGAVWDQNIMNATQVISSKGLNPEVYFNSGVILFNLNNIRKINWYEEMLNFLRTFPDTTMPDQDTLNFIYGKNYMPLDLRFNSFNMALANHDFTNKIVHFAGDEKCWHPTSPGAEMYRSYLSSTPWNTQQTETGVNTAPSAPRKKKIRRKLKVRRFRKLKLTGKRKVTRLKLRLKKSRKLKMRNKRRRLVHVPSSRLRRIRSKKRI